MGSVIAKKNLIHDHAINCSLTDTCNPTCEGSGGECVAQDICLCAATYTGQNCTESK